MKQIFVVFYLGWLIAGSYLSAQTDCQPAEVSKIPGTILSVSDSGQYTDECIAYSKIPQNNEDPPAFLTEQLHHDTTAFESLACRTPAEWRFLTFYPNTSQEPDACYHAIAHRALAIDPISTNATNLSFTADTLTSVERIQLLSKNSVESSNTELAESDCDRQYLTDLMLDTNAEIEILKSKELQDFINYYNCPRQYSIPYTELANYYKNRYDIELAEDQDNIELYAIVMRWLKVPYRYGGTTRHGMDCAAFTMLVCDSIFGKHLYRSANDQYRNILPIQKEELREGDLVFFKINKSRISHVGIYLKNNKFAHATVNEGIVISDLNEYYYRRYWFGAGRLSNEENNDFTFPATATAATNAMRKAQ